MSRFAFVVPIMAGAGLILGAGAVIAQTQGAGQSAPPAPCVYMMGPGMMGGYGPGMMGPGMMGPGMMGPGMMGGYGPGTMGPGMMGRSGQGMMGWNGTQQRDLNLSAADAKGYLDRWVAAMGNPRLKAGAVVETDANTITADIVTVDKGALVQRFTIDRRNGYWQQAQ